MRRVFSRRLTGWTRFAAIPSRPMRWWGGELSLLIAIAACEMALREFAHAEGCDDIQPYIDSIIETQKECEEHGW